MAICSSIQIILNRNNVIKKTWGYIDFYPCCDLFLIFPCNSSPWVTISNDSIYVFIISVDHSGTQKKKISFILWQCKIILLDEIWGSNLKGENTISNIDLIFSLVFFKELTHPPHNVKHILEENTVATYLLGNRLCSFPCGKHLVHYGATP